MARSGLQTGQGSKLWEYWTRGKGLARWADSPRPWTTLRAALSKYGIPPGQLDGLTDNIYRAVFHRQPPHSGRKT